MAKMEVVFALRDRRASRSSELDHYNERVLRLQNDIKQKQSELKGLKGSIESVTKYIKELDKEIEEALK